MFWREHSYVAYSTTYVAYLTLRRKSAYLRRKKISCLCFSFQKGTLSALSSHVGPKGEMMLSLRSIRDAFHKYSSSERVMRAQLRSLSVSPSLAELQSPAHSSEHPQSQRS